MKHGFAWATACTVMAFASPALAADDFEILISEAGHIDRDGSALVELLLLNNGPDSKDMPLPDRVEAEVMSGKASPVWLERASDTPATIAVPPKGFARARYRFTPPPGQGQGAALISIPLWATQQVAMSPSSPTAGKVELASQSKPAQQARKTAGANGFFDNLSAYEPMYIVFGTAKDSEWRVQLSFKYRLLGAPPSDGSSWNDGLYLGFTQRLFWDIASDASFRDANYLPELFYRTSPFSLGSNGQLGVQAGIQHESNGRSGDLGRSVNNVYVSPHAMFDLGGGYKLMLAPRAWVLVGGRAGNPDIQRYRGNTGLNVQIGQDDGLRLSAYSRYNFSTGKGAVTTELSYPLPRLFGGGPEFYLFGQSFVGYGESLLDYDRRMTRLRVGLAITR